MVKGLTAESCSDRFRLLRTMVWGGISAAIVIILFFKPAFAQQYTIDVEEVDEIQAFHILPDCVNQSGSQGCMAVVLMLSREFVADYADDLIRERSRTGQNEQYSRSRSGQVYVLTFPPSGGSVIVEEPGEVLHDNIISIAPSAPGSVRNFVVEKASYSGVIAERRVIRHSRRGEGRQQLPARTTDVRAEVTDRAEPDETVFRTQAVRPGISAYLVSLNYIHYVRTVTTLFRDRNLPGLGSGEGYSLKVHYVNGLRSFTVGATYLDTQGNYINNSQLRNIDEQFTHSHIGLFASYAPSFPLYRDQNSFASLYAEVGAGASYVKHSYIDVESNFYEAFTEQLTLEYELIEDFLPGINAGLGIMLQYQYIGLQLGIQYEGLYDYDFGSFINTLYPRAGISIRIM